MNVGYDIDDTLITYDGKLITEIYLDLLKEYDKGNNIFLITARLNNKSVREFTENQLKFFGIDECLDIKNDVFYTSFNSKVPYIKDLNLIKFHDDMDYNINDINMNLYYLNPRFKIYKIIKRNNKYKKINKTKNRDEYLGID